MPPLLRSSTPLPRSESGLTMIDVRRTPKSEPLVIGHRGIASRAPENTLASYRQAIELGIAVVECDVHLTADGVPVAIHDDDLLRTTGVAGKIADFTRAEIEELDAGSWKGPEFANERIPTLEQLLELTRDRAVLVVELKDPNAVQAVVDAMRKCGVKSDGVVIFAWDVETLDRVRALEPELSTTLLVKRPPVDAAQRERLFSLARSHEIPRLGVENRDLDRALFRRAHDAGLEVWVWTVNQPEEMRRLAEWGADGIISDYPDVAQRAVNPRSISPPPSSQGRTPR
jgi:glycerophosphoryl diester phosphodiesterase